MTAIEDWWADGERVPLELSGVEREIFVRHVGEGPPLTILHGFPSSSHDFHKVVDALAFHHSLLLPDFLGFGASDKPIGHVYSLDEQADLVEALWEREGIAATAVLAHDYAVSVVQELLARRAGGVLQTEITAVHLLNGGLYPELHRPQPIQQALLDPEQGPLIGELLTEELFVAGLQPTFGEGFDATGDSADIWRATSRDGGQLISHLLIRYITDRAEHGERWVQALQSTDVPLSFTWGMLDPVSGAHMAQRIRDALPDAPFEALAAVGHWPQLEAPQQLIASVLAATVED